MDYVCVKIKQKEQAIIFEVIIRVWFVCILDNMPQSLLMFLVLKWK